MEKKSPSLARMLVERGPIRSTDMDPADARRCWNGYRIDNGATSKDRPYTLPGETNEKMRKNGTVTWGLTLAPASASELVNVCTNATSSCIFGCVLWSSGKGTLASVRKARAVRTRFLAEHPVAAVVLAHEEIKNAAANAGDLLVRMNVASDLPWEVFAPDLFSIPGARFYDYTKVPSRIASDLPESYRLVFSFSEAPHAGRVSEDYLSRGGTVAVVFDTKRGAPLPDSWRGFPVIDGDESDDRSADPRSVVVGLRAKGAGRTIPTGGFIQPGRTLLPLSVS